GINRRSGRRERGEYEPRLRSRPSAHAASKRSVTWGIASPCSIRSARTRSASTSALASASSRVDPYAITPGRATTSAIQRPSSSRSISTMNFPAAMWRTYQHARRITSGRSDLREAVGARQLRVLLREQLRERHHHLALLPGGVVLHLAVEHEDAAAVGHRLEDALRELHLLDRRAEDALRDVDLARMQGPGADAAEQEGGAELVLAAERVGDVAERPVEREAAGRGARVDHPGNRVVPRVLLRGRTRRGRLLGVRVGADEIGGMAATDARRLHAPRRGEIGGPEADPLHARARGAD